MHIWTSTDWLWIRTMRTFSPNSLSLANPGPNLLIPRTTSSSVTKLSTCWARCCDMIMLRESLQKMRWDMFTFKLCATTMLTKLASSEEKEARKLWWVSYNWANAASWTFCRRAATILLSRFCQVLIWCLRRTPTLTFFVNSYQCLFQRNHMKFTFQVVQCASLISAQVYTYLSYIFCLL